MIPSHVLQFRNTKYTCIRTVSARYATESKSVIKGDIMHAYLRLCDYPISGGEISENRSTQKCRNDSISCGREEYISTRTIFLFKGNEEHSFDFKPIVYGGLKIFFICNL